MKEIKSIIRQLREHDVRLSFLEGRLDMEGLEGKVSDSLLADIRQHRSGLESYLAQAQKSVDLSPIKAVASAESYAISPSQRRLWISSQFEGASRAYNMPSVYLFTGTLDVAALEYAFRAVIARHESLRTVFREGPDGQVRQWVLQPEDAGFAIESHDFRDKAAPEDAAAVVVRKAFAAPFDLVRGPLMRATLIRVATDRWIFVYVMHHIISDGWSMGVLMKDLLGYYGAPGDNATLPGLRIQYRDFSAWQIAQLTGQSLQLHRDYWMQQLDGVLPVVDLPGQKRRPSVKTYRGGIVSGCIDGSVGAGIKALGGEKGATLFMSLLAAVKTLFYHYTKQEDIIIGTPVAGRDHPDVQDQIGFYVNTLALRTKFAGSDSYSKLIGLVRETTLEAYRHQVYPFDELVEDLKIDRDMSRNPLFDIQVIVRNAGSKDEPELPGNAGLSISSYKGIDTENSVFDMVFDFLETRDGLYYNIIFNSDVYDQSVAEMVASHLRQLLPVLLDNPDMPIENLDLLDERERDELLGIVNDTKMVIPQGATLVSLFMDQCLRTPEAPAVVFRDATLTYRELEERSRILCNWLQATGKAGPDCLIGVMLDRSDKLIVAILGVLRAGCAYVPVDPVLPSSRKEAMLKDAGCAILITQTDYIFDLDYFDGEVFAIDVQLDAADAGIAEDGSAGKVGEAASVAAAAPGPGQLAYVIYTSGSTGDPKGVMIEHHSIVNTIMAQIVLFGVKEGERNLQFASASFDASVSEIFVSLLSGGVLYIADEETRRMPSLLGQYIDSNSIGIATLPPAYLRQMNIAQLVALRCLVTAGEAANGEDANTFLEMGDYINAYGPTESSICATASAIKKGDRIGYRNVPIGRPIANTRIYVLSERGKLVPTGVLGEVYIAGDGLARGYWGRPDRTAERFVADPFHEGDRMYRTGDLGRWLPGGELEFVGRNDSQVKVRGFRVELGEIEAVLNRYSPVETAVVIGRQGASGSVDIVAYTVARGALNLSETRTWLSKYLPEYMIPAHFVQLEKMPMTPSGKVDRKALPHILTTDLGSGETYVAPRNATERRLADIWEEILGKDRVGVKDNFFDLGGHSLKATRLVGQINREFGVKIELKDLFSWTVLEDQGKLIDDASIASYVAIPQVEEREGYVLSSSQRRLWILNKLEPDNTAYNMPGASAFEGELDPLVLERSFLALLARHESLRTVFRENEAGEVFQYILPAGETGFRLNYSDLTREPAAKAILQGKIHAECKGIFDLSTGPLIRASLYRTGADRWILNYVVHHIITDGWSMDILIRELLQLYSCESKGLPDPLEPLRIQYKDYAAWQQSELISGQVANEHKHYWLEQFAGELPVLQLPGFQPRPAVRTYSGAVVSCSIDGNIRNSIRKMSVDQGGTMFIGILGVVNALLYRYTQQTDIVIGTSVSSREHPDIENQIGFYVNTLALRTKFNGGDSYRELLDKVKQVVLPAYQHQVYPFDDLVAQLNLQRDRSRHPLFDVMVVLHTLEGKVVAGYQDLTDLRVWGYEGADHIVSKFDMTFFFSDADDDLRLQVVYNRDIYSEQMVTDLTKHFSQLMSAIAEDPYLPVSKLGMLSGEEQSRLMALGRSVNRTASKAASVVSLFEEQVDRDPVRTAVVCGGSSLTYGELEERANKLANYLRETCGVRRDDLVGIYLDRSESVIVAMLGILKAGAAYVPLDTESPRARNELIIRDTAMKALVTQSCYLFDLDHFGGHLFAIDIQLDAPGLSAARPDSGTQPGDLAYAVYTSGTTGEPKGVMITHGAVVDYYWGIVENTNIAACESYGLFSTPAADLGNTVIYPALLTGGRLHIFSVRDLVDAGKMAQCRLDCAKIVPGHWKALQMGDSGFIPDKCLIFGGERLTADIVESLRARRPTCEIYNHYGPSETTIGKLINRIDLEKATGNPALGRPFGNTRVYLCDESDNLVPQGVPGQICIGGDGLARGYHHQPELTAQKFVADPLKEGERIYKTGDWGRWLPDGIVEFIGRKDDQVKIRGYRIEPGEIEAVLGRFDGVERAAVIVHTVDGREPALVACYVSTEDVSGEDIKARLQQALPSHMVPQHFVRMEALPLTANGKLDRRALAAAVLDPVGTGQSYVAPATATEAALAAIWEEVLRVERAGVTDDFFMLGGHSLAATRLASLIHKKFEVKLDFYQLFTYAILGDQARLIDNAIRSAFVAIPAAQPGSAYPLSSSQRRLWVLQQLVRDSTAYHMSGDYAFTGELDAGIFERAFNEVVGRHEILRTVFREDGSGEPLQWILSCEEPAFSMRTLDLRADSDPAGAILRLVRDGNATPFDLGRGPLLRATLYRKADNEWIFAYVMHHIISDGWSMNILIRELLASYEAFTSGAVPDLSPLRLQYKDYAVWQQEQLRDGLLAQQRVFWLKTLEGPLPVLNLLPDLPRPAMRTFNGATVEIALNEASRDRLLEFSIQQGSTMFIGLVTVLNALLYKYSDSKDIIVGCPVAGRQHADLADQIGFYVNTLALRTVFSSEESFAQLHDRVKKVVIDAFDHQLYPFDELVGELQVPHDGSRSPLFDVLIDFHEAGNGDDRRTPDGVSIKRSGLARHDVSKFDLTFMFVASDKELLLSIEYNSDLFVPATVGKMATHFVRLLDSMLARPQVAIGRVPLVDAAEWDELIVRYNDLPTAHSGYRTVVDLFEEQARKYPDACAVTYNGVGMTYRELDEQSNRLANHLQEEHGLQTGDLAGIMLDRSEKVIVSILGILKTGAAYVPVDPAYPRERKEFIFRDTGLKVLLTQTEYIFSLPDFTGAVLAVDIQLESLGASGGSPGRQAKEGDLAYVIYTSGSTGSPKGCAITHGGLSNYVRWANGYYFGDSDKPHMGLYTSLSFDLTVTAIFCPLTMGGHLHVYRQDEELSEIFRHSFSPGSGIDSIKITPSHLSVVQGLGLSSSTMMRAIVGGEQLTPAHVGALRNAAPGIRIYNEYGPTEATVGNVVMEIEEDRPIRIGRPIPGTSVYILNEALMPCPVGIVGELYIAGVGLAREYLNQPDLTAVKFVDNPFRPGTKMYKTGDLGRWQSDGYIEYNGRSDHQLKVRGYRIEPGEIEAALLQQEQVKEALVTATPAGDLVAYLIGKGELNLARIKDDLARKLPVFMIPTYCVQLERWPYTVNGKLDKAALPDAASAVAGKEYIAPRNPTEEKLAEIWQETFRREQIGMKDDFFELGGHSLKATRLAARIHKEFDIRIELKELFSVTVLEDQARLIEQMKTAAFVEIPRVAEGDGYVLSSSQQRLWVLSQFEETGIAYHMPVAYLFTGELNRPAFEYALYTLIERHESLRTVFREDGNGAVRQYILPAGGSGYELEFADLRGQPEPMASLSGLITERFRASIDLGHGPLARWALYRTADDTWAFACVMHHIVSDGWSMRVLFGELLEIYRAYCSGQQHSLAPLRIQYKDYAAWQQERLAGSGLTEQRDYWLAQLGGDLPVLDLPGDNKRPAIKTYNGGIVRSVLPPDVSHELKTLSHAQGSTFFVGLLSVVNALLYKYTGQKDLVIGTLVAGRGHADLESQIGFYVNTLALRFRFDDTDSLRSLMEKTKDVVFDAYRNQDYPFDELVNALKVRRDMSRSALFDVMVVLHNEEKTEESMARASDGLTVAEFGEYERLNSKFDLTFNFVEKGEELQLDIEYNRDIYGAAAVERLVHHFAHLAGALLKKSGTQLRYIDLVGAAERRVLLEEFNTVEQPARREKTIHGMFEERVALGPDVVALVSGGREYSYREVNASANRLAGYLRHHYALRPDDLVGIQLPHSHWAVVSILAVLKAGAAYVPVDPDYPQERMAFMKEDSGWRVLIDEEELGRFAREEDEYDPGNGSTTVRPANLAYVIYTSGSTGKPKGVMVEHRNVVSFFGNFKERFCLEEGMTLGATTGFTFDISVLELLGSLVSGMKLVMLPGKDPAGILERVMDLRVDVLQVTPSWLNQMLDASGGSIEGLAGLKVLLVGGEALGERNFQRLKGLSTTKVFSVYGPTETTIWSSVLDVNASDVLSLGYPLNDETVDIRDAWQNLTPIGVVGEICIGGAGVARGYLHKPELTAQKFVSDLVREGLRIYRTGDLGRWRPDGTIEFFGRVDDQMKINGYRIEPGEIENAIGAFPGVEASVVTAALDERGDKTLVAYIAGKQAPAIAELRAFLSARLPVHLLPVHYITMEAFPLNSSGKVDKKRLPDPLAVMGRGEEESPANEVEAKIAGIWTEILSRDKMGMRDNFFLLGGNSLRAIRVLTRLRTEFEVDIKIIEVFNNPTIELLAGEVVRKIWAKQGAGVGEDENIIVTI